MLANRNDMFLFRKIAGKTGLEEEKIAKLFAGLRPIVQGEREAWEQEMKDYIDGMNETGRSLLNLVIDNALTFYKNNTSRFTL